MSEKQHSTAKKVKDIYVEILPSTLLSKKKVETRSGIYQSEKKIEAVVKILQVEGSTTAMTNPMEIKLSTALYQMAKLSQQGQCFVQCYSMQKTKSSFYYAFEKCKQTIQTIRHNLYEFPKAQNELDVLYLLESLVAGLKQLHKVGIPHGNLKPSNIFYSKKIGQKAIFKFTDFYPPNLSDTIVNEFTAPEAKIERRSSFAADIYSLGSICAFYTGRMSSHSKKYQFSQEINNLIDRMLVTVKERITLQELDCALEQFVEKYQHMDNKADLLKRGINQDKIVKIIEECTTKPNSVANRNIQEFIIPTTLLALRNKAAFYYMLSDIVRIIQVNDLLINTFVIASVYASHQVYQECQFNSFDVVFSQVIEQEREVMKQYLNKIILMCEIYCMDLQLYDQNTQQLQELIKCHQNETKCDIFKISLQQLLQEIMDKNVIKKVLYDVQDRDQIRALNYLNVVNQMDMNKCYDYQGLVLYLNSLDNPI